MGNEVLGLPTQDYGEPKRELCHHYGDQPLVDSIYKVCQGHGLPTQDYGEPKRELCHHHGDQLLVDSFIPMPMESPRGSSAIIMEFCRRTHLIWLSICSHVCDLGIFKCTCISPFA